MEWALSATNIFVAETFWVFYIIKNIDYWKYIKDPDSSEICGYGLANKNSLGCGNCNYGAGSACGSARGTGVNPTYGDYICRDLDCTYKGGTKSHGSAWCSESLSYFETANPGDSSYKLSCYKGEVQWEPCDTQRNKLCKEECKTYDDSDPPECLKTDANCISNRWQDCVFQVNSKACLDASQRDCKVLEGVSRKDENGDILFLNYTYTYDSAGILTSESSNSIKAVCVARYPPGFNFWDPSADILGIEPEITPAGVCSAGSVSSVAGYNKRLTSEWEAKEGKCFGECIEECAGSIVEPECQQICFLSCPPSESFENMPWGQALGNVNLNQNWATGNKGLCVSLGDCGVKPNYLLKGGYYSWKELFIGDNISKTNIPGADNYQ